MAGAVAIFLKRFENALVSASRARFSSTSTSDQPLAGVRILDLSRVLAGPYCSMILGDMGAEVIKVEKAFEGDMTREWGPPFLGKESAYFIAINRNKKSVAIDLAKGSALIQQLASKCDVLLENTIPGTLDKYELGYESLSKDNPSLIYCSLTGFGPTGPYSKRAGFDTIAAALGGLMNITGPSDGDPCRVGVAVTDICTGLYTHGAILSALYHRKNTGKGGRIDTNLLSTQLAVLSHISSNYLNAGMLGERYGTAHPSLVPYQAFKCSDDYIVTGAGNNKQFVTLCKVMKLDNLLDDDRFKNNSDRVKHREELLSAMSERFLEKSAASWLDEFEGTGVPYGPVNNMEQAFNDPQVLHNGVKQTIYHPSIGKEVHVAGPPVSYSQFGQPARLAPPTLGQHTRPVLKDLLNLTDKEIDALAASRTIQTNDQ